MLIDSDKLLPCLWDYISDTDYEKVKKVISEMPSAESERLTDDDFETIRIHLSAYKEQLGNQHRWKEAEEYQRIIDRLMIFASAEPEIVHCMDCKWWHPASKRTCGICRALQHDYHSRNWGINIHRICSPEFYCADAERRTENDISTD